MNIVHNKGELEFRILKMTLYPAFLTKKFGCGQGVRKMVAETYLCTLSKPFSGQRSPRGNFAAPDRVFFGLNLKMQMKTLTITWIEFLKMFFVRNAGYSFVKTGLEWLQQVVKGNKRKGRQSEFFDGIRHISFRIPGVLTAIILSFQSVNAQQNPDFSESYLTPPESIAGEVLAPRHLNTTLDDLDPEGEVFLNRKRTGPAPLAAFAKPFYNLAGLQIDWQANRRRSLTTQRATTGLELIGARNGESLMDIEVPENATVSHPQWSPDGEQVAWFAHFDEETHIYVSDPETGASKRITPRPVLATLYTGFEWSGDGQYIFAVILPENRGAEPVEADSPVHLQVRKTSDDENRLRTYPSLLQGRYEVQLFDYYTTGQLVRMNVDNQDVQPVGEPALIQALDADSSEKGEYIIVQTLQKPFSRIVPVSRFAWKEEIWNLKGEALVELRKREAREGIPDHDEMEDYGRRDIQWRPDGEGLSLLLKKDNGDDVEDEDDIGEDEKQGDRLMHWHPPFGEEDLEVIYESSREMRSVSYSDDGDMILITERHSGDEHLYALFPDQPDTTYTIYEYERDNFYENPGDLMHKPGVLGVSAVRLSPDREHVFLSGAEYFEDVQEKAPRPFIDRVEIRTGEKQRIFQSTEETYEWVSAVLDDEIRELVLVRESPEMIPDSWLYNVETEELTRLTDNTDYNEAVTGAWRERLKVQRADGFEFWVNVVLPAGWNGEPLPGLIWHYPREYSDQEDYNESLRRYNKNRFPDVGTRTMDILVKEGYAVIRPDWPITGNRGSSNDNFVWSIVQNSTAVIDSAAARGYIDRSRMAIGGHSYGAFGAANAMIHTSFFKAGIAGDGNFNRTLTPLGFQSEGSDLWRGQDRYLQMSPIFRADRLDGALLMYHGEEDQNVGTWPTNSRRMLHALNGIGKTAVLYMYPYEGHGPSAKETLLDLWRRWTDWLDYYVKEGAPVQSGKEIQEDEKTAGENE